MTDHCSHCGVDILFSTSRFCHHCGQPLAAEVEEATMPSPLEVDPDEAGEVEEATVAYAERVSQGRSSAARDPQAEEKPAPSRQSTATNIPQKTHAGVAAAKTVVPKMSGEVTLPKGIDITGQIIHQRYQVLKTLGKGGFGAVYLAQDLKLERLCVVKQMLPKRKTPQKMKLDQANFQREARLLVQLNQPGHPDIPEIYDHFFDEKGNYLVMKYIEGRSLQQLLDEQENRLPVEAIADYAATLGSALHYMHTYFDEPVMHRDIKPANILLGDDGRLWLVDFGLAKAKPVDDTSDIGVTQASGSVGYTALEQWLGEAEPASDIYALGATLHYLLTGLSPAEAYDDDFNILKLQQRHGQFIPIRKVDDTLPEALEGIVASATGADPDQRPTALQLQQQFEAFISGARDVPLFTFKNGEAAKTKGKLVDLCDDHKKEAQGYLYRGDFERWFRLINRNDLAEAAAQGVKRGKNQRDGLEKFLKLVLPNLFLRRLKRASLHVARGSVQFVLTAIVVIALLAIGGSYIARLVLWRAIGTYDWNYDIFEADKVNTYSEAYLNEAANSGLNFIFNKVSIDVQAPDQINVGANWGGVILLELPLKVQQMGTGLDFQLTEINNIPLYLITDNLSQGINAGVAMALSQAPIDIADIEIKDTALSLDVRRRQPNSEPLTQATATPATLDDQTMLAVVNDLDQAIILELNGQSWPIAANGTELIHLEPGTYSYAVKFTENEPPLGEGEKTWTLGSYELHIDLNGDRAAEIKEDN